MGKFVDRGHVVANMKETRPDATVQGVNVKMVTHPKWQPACVASIKGTG